MASSSNSSIRDSGAGHQGPPELLPVMAACVSCRSAWGAYLCALPLPRHGLSSARSRSHRGVWSGDPWTSAISVAAAANGLDDARALAVVTQLLGRRLICTSMPRSMGRALATAGGVRDGIPVRTTPGCCRNMPSSRASLPERSSRLPSSWVSWWLRVSGSTRRSATDGSVPFFLRLAEFGAAQRP